MPDSYQLSTNPLDEQRPQGNRRPTLKEAEERTKKQFNKLKREAKNGTELAEINAQCNAALKEVRAEYRNRK